MCGVYDPRTLLRKRILSDISCFTRAALIAVVSIYRGIYYNRVRRRILFYRGYRYMIIVYAVLHIMNISTKRARSSRKLVLFHYIIYMCVVCVRDVTRVRKNSACMSYVHAIY